MLVCQCSLMTRVSLSYLLRSFGVRNTVSETTQLVKPYVFIRLRTSEELFSVRGGLLVLLP